MKLYKNLVILIASVLLFTACTFQTQSIQNSDGDDDDVFTVGFFAAESVETMTLKAQAVADFLTEEMGMEVEILVPSSYESLVEGLYYGHLDAAYMEAGSAFVAHEKSNAEVVLVELLDGKTSYHSAVYAYADNPKINIMEDLIGKRVAFTAWTGASGFILPVGNLIESGAVRTDSDDFVSLGNALSVSFKYFVFSGGYEQSLSLLLNNNVEAVAVPESAIRAYLTVEDQKSLKPIASFGPIPSHSVLVAEHVNPVVKVIFSDAMFELNKEENVEMLKDLYGAEELAITTTKKHFKDFNSAFEGLNAVKENIIMVQE